MRFWLFSLLFIASEGFAQQWLGISSSNYSGTYSIYQNPANVVDTRYKAVINLAGGNVDFSNNYASWAAPFSLVSMATNNVASQYRNASGLIIFRNDYVKKADNRQNSNVFLGAEARTPAIMYNFTKAKFAVGLTSRARLLTNITKLSPQIGRVLVEGTTIPDFYNIDQTNTHFNLNVNAYTELAATFGFILQEQGQDFVKIGVSVKRINGMINTYLQAENVDFLITEHPTRPKRQVVDVNNAIGNFAMSSMQPLNSLGFSPEWLIGNLPVGIGYGADIGFVYEYRPDFQKYEFRHKGKWTTNGTKNKYLYKIGVSLLDIGQVRYRQLDYAQIIGLNRTGIIIQPGTFTDIKTTDRLYKAINTSFAVPESDYFNSYTIALPAAFNVNFDYKISEKIYLNAYWLQSLSKTNGKAMIQPSMFAITPRFETKWFDVTVPIALQNGYRNFSYGISARAGGFFIGSDNLRGFFKAGNPNGINAYAGLFVPIHRRLPNAPNECYSEYPPTWLDKFKINRNKRNQAKRWKRIR